jgi:hypothetical protein
MKLLACILCGACLGLFAGYYGVLLLSFVFLPRLGNLVGLPAVFVGAPMGMLMGAMAGGRLCARQGATTKLLAGILGGAGLGVVVYIGVLRLIGRFLPPAALSTLVLLGFPVALVIGAMIGGWLCRH